MEEVAFSWLNGISSGIPPSPSQSFTVHELEWGRGAEQSIFKVHETGRRCNNKLLAQLQSPFPFAVPLLLIPHVQCLHNRTSLSTRVQVAFLVWPFQLLVPLTAASQSPAHNFAGMLLSPLYSLQGLQGSLSTGLVRKLLGVKGRQFHQWESKLPPRGMKTSRASFPT